MASKPDSHVTRSRAALAALGQQRRVGLVANFDCMEDCQELSKTTTCPSRWLFAKSLSRFSFVPGRTTIQSGYSPGSWLRRVPKATTSAVTCRIVASTFACLRHRDAVCEPTPPNADERGRGRRCESRRVLGDKIADLFGTVADQNLLLRAVRTRFPDNEIGFLNCPLADNLLIFMAARA